MAKQEKINFDQVEELDWQANENYPWEYEVKDEVWLADLSKIAKLKKVKKTLVQPEVQVSISEQIISDPQNIDDKATEEKITVVDAELKFDPLLLQKSKTDSRNEEGTDLNQKQEAEVFEPSETIISSVNDRWFEEQKKEKQTKIVSARNGSLSGGSFDWSDNFSWVFASAFLFLFVLAGEIALHYFSQHWYWSANYLLLSLWLWRIAVLIIWFYLGAKRWFLATEKIIITAVLGELLAVFVSGIYRIFVIKSLWTWLNLVVEPIWTLLIIAVMGSIFVKIMNK